MQSVCLITPPSAFLLDERVFVSLGVLKVAGALEANGFTVNLLDFSGVENYLQVLKEYLADDNDIAVGITATTPQFPAVSEIVKAIRAVRPEMKVILGGPHITLTLAACKLENKRGVHNGRASRAWKKLEDRADVLVAGDGEFAILRALEESTPKTIDADDPKGGLFMSDKQYNDSPFPSRHLIDMSSYHYTIDGHNATSLISQLGCPFGCGFCGGRNSKSLRMIRTRTVDSIIQELESLYTTYGYTGFMFYDDELNVNPGLIPMLNRITDLQDRLGVEFRLRAFVKSELFNKEQAQALYRSGFRWLLCGYETASPRMLTNINKRATLEDNTRCIETAKEAGLKVKALMSVGHPGESEDSVLAVQDWLLKVRPEDFDCTIITPYPGSPYYDEAVPGDKKGLYVYTQPKTGDKLYAWEVDYSATASYYKGIPGGGYKSFVYTDYLSEEKLVSMRDSLETNVRETLGIPFNASHAALRYEHSMGQGLPSFILKRGNYEQ
jgi:anaerobic magnesium-protoporphyrin IX monomethyl ester cyclase